MIINRSISKEQIKQYPRAKFPGAIEVINTTAAAKKALEYLNTKDTLGIDTETRPAFKKGITHKVSLMQIASNEVCFLFRLNKIGLIPELVELLENPNIMEIGVSLRDDFMMLHKRKPFKQQSCIDLQNEVKQFGISDKSLQKIYAILFKEKISKSQRLSNWEATELSEAQQRYAALDAWSCLRIFTLLLELKKSKAYTIVPTQAQDTVNNK